MTEKKVRDAVAVIMRSKGEIGNLRQVTEASMKVAMMAIPFHKEMGLSDDDIFAVLLSAGRNIPENIMRSVCAAAMLKIYNLENDSNPAQT